MITKAQHTEGSRKTARTTNWVRYVGAGFIGLVTLGYLCAIVLGLIDSDRRLDTTSLILAVIGMAVITLLVNPHAFSGVRSLAWGSFKVQLDQIRQQQDYQQYQVDSISAVLAMLITDSEQAHLLKLAQRTDYSRTGDHDLRTELRRLRGMRLLEMKQGKTVAELADGVVADLKEYVRLTDLGERIVHELERIAREERKRRETASEGAHAEKPAP